EQPLFENRVLAVPERQTETEALLVVGDPGEAVFPPAIGARPRMVVREEVPGVAVLAVVLADGPPLSFTQVRPPLLPGSLLAAGLVQSDLFCGHRLPQVACVPLPHGKLRTRAHAVEVARDPSQKYSFRMWLDDAAPQGSN